MPAYQPGAVRPVAPVLRAGLGTLAVTQFAVGLPVMVAPGETDRYFAWTIDVELTAAFLGACYWASMVFSLACALERVWAYARVVIPGVLAAGTLILLATVLHLERFAMDTARGWIWLILYAGLPPGVLLLLMVQLRVAGGDPPAGSPLTPWARLVMVAQAAVLAGLGAAFFVVPGETASLWPWDLTDLTARMTGSWMVALGVAMVAALRERARDRLRAPMIYLVLIAGLQLGAVARYPQTPEWDGAAAWLYLSFLALLLAIGLYGLVASVRARRR